MRLAVLASHPIQYQAPLFRELGRRIDLKVFFAHRATPADQGRAGFGVEFDWDVDLLTGYEHIFLRNVARRPNIERFSGCDTPDLSTWLREGRFDAVLVMGWHLKSFLQAIFAAKSLGIPVMARSDSHLQTPRAALKRLGKALVYPNFLRRFNAALYVGERSKAYWRHYRYPPAQLFFSPHCVDAEWFAPRATAEARVALRQRLGIAPNRKVALFVGKLVPLKQPLDLIAAASRLKSDGPAIELMVAGSGPLQSEIREAAQTAGVCCHLLGFCNQSEMPAVYAAADVLVLPSAHETWGLVANEALACGRAVVVSDAVGAAPDLIADGSVSRVYPMGNIVALAQTLRNVLINPPESAAIKALSARFSVSAASDGIERAACFAIGHRSRAGN